MDVALIAEQRDLGVPARVVPLDGLLPLPSGAKASTTLVQTDRGVWLLASDGMESAARSLSRNPTCRYEPRLVGDRLHADGLVFGVPMGRGAEVRMALGAGRLLANATHRSEHLPHGSFAEAPGDLAEVWLSTFLEPDELPLAWLQSSDRRGVRSDLLTEEAELRYLLTSARHALVSLNSVGDVQVLGLDPLSLEVEGGSGRCTVRAGSHSWRSTRTNAEAYRAIAHLPQLEPRQRLRELAAMEWTRQAQRSRALLEEVAKAEDPLDRLLLGLCRDETPVQEALALTETMDGESLVKTLEPWSLPALSLRALAVGVVEARPELAAWTLPLHRTAWGEGLKTAAPLPAAELDLALAEHLLLAGHPDQAAELLQERLGKLPPGDLSDLLPPPDADLSAGEAGQAHRIRTLELLSLSQDGGAWLAQLAQLQPLVTARVRALAEEGPEALRERAQHVLALHASLSPAPAEHRGTPRTLDSATVELMRHPAARSQGALGWIQGWVARQKTPDRETLKDYCEPLSSRRHPDAVRAMTSSALALGTPGLEGFLSHGKLGLGLRVYDGDPPYVLIGGEHAHSDGSARLEPAELLFALGSEVGHLRFGHTRVTDGEVWRGAVDKVGKALDLAASAIAFGTPVGKVIGDARPWKLLQSVFSPTTLATVQAADSGTRAISALTPEVTDAIGTPRTHLGVDPRELVVAHRVMQLTADRCGLALCGDLRAAVRGLMLTSPRGRTELPVAEQHGLRTALARRGGDGELLNQDLAIRVAALLGFYLSEEYEELQKALYGVSTPSGDCPEPSSMA